MEPKIITNVVGKNGREFQTNVEICHSRIENFERPLQEEYVALLEEHGPNLANLIWQLMGVNGVNQIFVEPYEISVYMADAFDWNPEINKIVKKAIYDAQTEKTQVKGKKIVIETFPNNQIREYHTNFEVCKSDREEFYRPLRVSSLNPLLRVGVVGGEMVRMLFCFPGITEVTVKPYLVRVEIGKAFDWKKIEPKIFDAFEKVFGRGLVVSGKVR